MSSKSKLACIHRGERLETRGTCAEGCQSNLPVITLSRCNLLDRPCSIVQKTKEGYPVCSTCEKKESPTVADSPKPSISPSNSSRSNLVTVPTPPPLSLSPTSTRAVVTLAAGGAGRELIRLSRSWMERYAKRLGADLVVLDWECPDYPIYSKFAIYRTLEHYDRIAYVDADTLADPEQCPDLFARVPPGHFGAYDDGHALRVDGKWGHFADEVAQVRASQGMPANPLKWYTNTGIFVAERIHRDLLRPPSRPLPKQHCGEQSLFVARLHDAGVPVHFLPDDCNREWWEHRGFGVPQPPGSILHFSGMSAKDDRPGVMKRFARQMGLIPPWEPYIICAIPRTGSNLLRFALEDAGLGDPTEILNPVVDSRPKTLEMVREHRCGKILYDQLEWTELADKLLIPDAKYISLTRRDLVRQAVSMARAWQTRQYIDSEEKRAEPRYDQQLLVRALYAAAQQQSGWEAYYKRHEITPLRVYYEDLEVDYTGTVRRVLDFLGEQERAVPAPRITKQADELSEEWYRRFFAYLVQGV